MIRNVSLEDISDGKLYELNDMVKADCNDCKGCSKCCRGMGDSIVLDPYDIYELKKGLGNSFEELMKKDIKLSVIDGLILPVINMDVEEKCAFLDINGRCSIHSFRPGICRLFPLGRYYEKNGFKYFLQTNECVNTNRTKIKVKKWLGYSDVIKHEQFVNKWHYFLKNIEEDISKKDADFSKKICIGILNQFYIKDYTTDFYMEFDERSNQLL